MVKNKFFFGKKIFIFLTILSIVFIIGFFAGAISYKKGQFSFYKNNLTSLSKNFTKIIPNLLYNFQNSKIDKIYIETDTSDFWKIKNYLSNFI